MKKRLLCLLLATVMIAGTLPLAAIPVSAGSAEYAGISVDYGNAACTSSADGSLLLIFSNVGVDTLRISGSAQAHILVVGGGGSGSSGGTSSSTVKSGYGGNGGSVIEREVTLQAGDYSVSVGKGGASVTGTASSRTPGKAGMDSSFSGNGISLSAEGGKGGTSESGYTCRTTSDITGEYITYGSKGADKTSSSTAANGMAGTGAGGDGGYSSKSSGTGGSGTVIIRLNLHTHVFSYGTDPDSADTLTATCGQEKCVLEAPLKLTMTDEGAFDKEQLEAWRAAGAKEPVISYTSLADSAVLHDGDCFKAGDYSVSASVGGAVVTKKFTVAGGHVHVIGGHAVEFTGKTLTGITSAGSYYLTGNPKLTSDWKVPGGTVNLCLNGHTINLNKKQILITSGKTLNIFDCGTEEYYFKESTTTATKGMWVSASKASATHTVTGGIITGGNTTKKGGAISVSDGTLNIYGGNIVGNCSTESNGFGGAVFAENKSTVSVYGGAILGNLAGGSGGGIAAYYGSTLNLHGGSISYNTGGGGGVYVMWAGGGYPDAVFNMTGGTIGHNISSSNGGGVLTSGLFSMTGGIIEENMAVSTEENNGRGGGVRVASGSFVMTGGIIRNNTAVSGGGIHYAQGTVISGGLSTFDGSATFGGTAVVAENRLNNGTPQNVFVANGDEYSEIFISVGSGDNAPRDGMSVGIQMETPGVFTGLTENASDCLQYFFSDDEGFVVIDEGEKLKLVPGTACGDELFRFDAKNLALQSDLAFRFKGYLGKEASDDSYMEFIIGNNIRKVIVPLSEATVDSLGRHVFTCHLNVLEADEKIRVTFRDGDKFVARSSAQTLTDYLDYVMNRHASKLTEEDKLTVTLVEAISNYIHYAQKALDEYYGEYEVGEDGKYAETAGRSDVTLLTQEDLRGYEPILSGDYAAITGITRSLILDDKVSVAVHLTPADAGYTPVIKVTDKSGAQVDVSCEKQDDGRWKIIIPDIAAHRLGEAFTLDIDGGKLTVTNLSALSYAYTMSADSAAESIRYTVSALYEYNRATLEYAAFMNARASY